MVVILFALLPLERKLLSMLWTEDCCVEFRVLGVAENP